ncbi:MAG: CARDB domain-containing protein [Armatimonadota bacterium]
MKNKYSVVLLVLVLTLILTITAAFARGENPRGENLQDKKPDLAITGLNVSSWNPATIKFTIKNNGQAPANDYTYSLYALINGQWTSFGNVTGPDVAPGQQAQVVKSLEVFSQIKDKIASITKIKVVLDLANKLKENNKADNTAEIDFAMPKPAKPPVRPSKKR